MTLQYKGHTTYLATNVSLWALKARNASRWFGGTLSANATQSTADLAIRFAAISLQQKYYQINLELPVSEIQEYQIKPEIQIDQAKSGWLKFENLPHK